jgi:hypothetical protein
VSVIIIVVVVVVVIADAISAPNTRNVTDVFVTFLVVHFIVL